VITPGRSWRAILVCLANVRALLPDDGSFALAWGHEGALGYSRGKFLLMQLFTISFFRAEPFRSSAILAEAGAAARPLLWITASIFRFRAWSWRRFFVARGPRGGGGDGWPLGLGVDGA